MTRKKIKRGKRKKSSDNETQVSKVHKQGGPSGGSDDGDISVSKMLNKTNSVLYGEESLVDSVFVTSDFGVGVSEVSEVSAMAENTNGAEPTNRDLMDLLKNVSGRLDTVEKRLGAMEAIEKKGVEHREGHEEAVGGA